MSLELLGTKMKHETGEGGIILPPLLDSFLALGWGPVAIVWRFWSKRLP